MLSDENRGAEMEIRVLEYFLAVAREESVTGAAAALHLTQPTLSRQLRELEEELGKQLFIRGRRITLTEDGILLRRRAEEILDLVQKTEKDVMENVPAVSGDIYIGAAETPGMRLILKLAAKMQTEYPGVRFHVSSGDREDLLDRLGKGLDDFSLFMGDIDMSRCDSLRLPAADRWGILMRRDDPLARLSEISPALLEGRPLILSRQCGNYPQLFSWLGRPREALQIPATYNLAYNASLMAEENMGLVLTLEGLINASGDSPLVFRPLSPTLVLGMSVVWKKYPVFAPASAKFLEYLREEFPEG
jgi:DNA-binding transcriptional LysR family regulator